jgi:hypothetical protein
MQAPFQRYRNHITNQTLDVSGTITVAGTGSDTCDPSHYGANCRNPTRGALKICFNR